MEIKDIMDHVNESIHLHDPSIHIEYVSHDDDGLVMQVIILIHADKFMGLKNIAKIINRTLNKYNLKLKSLSLKK